MGYNSGANARLLPCLSRNYSCHPNVQGFSPLDFAPFNRENVNVIFGIGTDIIEVARIEKMAAKGTQYLETIFTKQERDYCETRVRKSEHYAARYAAKEAFLKALGTGWRDGLAFCDIEVINDELGKPQIFPHGSVKNFLDQHQIKQISTSISHVKEIAIAVVILEK
ncbi:MAG: holo-ACP synthase [Anaerolineales bacterium]|nr:holo-ACP synthase [Anaerolineales bacterium]